MRYDPFWVVCVVHWVFVVFLAFYPFLFAREHDIWFILLLFAVAAHWYLFEQECCLTYLEKKLLDPAYVVGSAIEVWPAFEVLDRRLRIVLFVMVCMSVIFVFVRAFGALHGAFGFLAFVTVCLPKLHSQISEHGLRGIL